MAKTRSQVRREKELTLKPSSELSKNLKQKKSNKKNNKVPHEFKNCKVRLTRLSQNEITMMLHGITQNNECEPKKYELRKRAPVEATIMKTTSSLNQLVAASQMALYTSKAIRIWEVLKKQHEKSQINLQVGQIVCARMAGHRPWPSKVVSQQKNGVKLSFFGTHDVGIVKRSQIIPYEFCKDVLEQYLIAPICDISNRTLLYHLSFIKACKELNAQNAQATPRSGDRC